MGTLLGVLLGPRLLAQQPAAPALPAQLTTITTDTGDMAPGHTSASFARYTRPSVCLAAVENAQVLLQRSVAAQLAADSLQRFAPLHDTLPAGVAAIARACGRRFAVATTSVAEVSDVFALALLAQDDSLAQAVLARWVALTTGDSARFAVEQQAVEAYLHAAPARLELAERALAQLDAQGAKARVARVQAHTAFLQVWLQMLDLGRTRQEAEQVLTLARGVPTSALSAYAEPLATAYRALLTVAYFTAPDSLPALARRAQQTLGQVPGPEYGPVFARAPLSTVLDRLLPVASVQVHNRQTPPLTADVWFPATAKDTVLPVRGRVSLFVSVSDQCDGSYVNARMLDPIATGCAVLYQALKRWHQQYGAAGLDITVVATVAPGLYGTVLSGPQSLAQAAENLKWYFLDYLKLPVQRLAVQAAAISPPVPAPDGRMATAIPLFGMTYTGGPPAYQYAMLGGWNAWTMALTDRNGVEVLRENGSSVVAMPALVEQVLRRVVTGPALAIPAVLSPPSSPASPAPAPAAAKPSATRSTASAPLAVTSALLPRIATP